MPPDATGYLALAGTIATAFAQVISARVSAAAKSAVDDAKKSLSAEVAVAITKSEEAKKAAEEMRAYVIANVGPVLAELSGLRSDVKRAARASTSTQPSLPDGETLSRLVGVDEISRRLGTVEQELHANRAAEAQRQREMGEVLALLRLVSPRLTGGLGR